MFSISCRLSVFWTTILLSSTAGFFRSLFELLRERRVQLVDVPDEEYETLGCNVLAISGLTSSWWRAIPSHGVVWRLPAAPCPRSTAVKSVCLAPAVQPV